MIKHFSLLIVTFILILNSSALYAENIEAGAAKRIITPDPLLPVTGGLGPGAPVTKKRGELTARAFVIKKGKTYVAIVSIDAIGFPSVLGNRIRKQVDRIPGENILIGSTHTHSAPDCYGFPDGKGGHTGDFKYMDNVCNKAAEAINEALDHLKPAYIRVNTDKAKGKIAYNYYAPQLYDQRMSVIQAVGYDEKAIVTLVNYATHPEVIGTKKGICSPDCIGPLCDKIEKETDGMAIFMNGANGGMITADNRLNENEKNMKKEDLKDGRSWEECLRIGNLMATEALRIVKSSPLQKKADLFCDSIDVTFPVESPLLWAIIVGSPLNYPHNKDQTITAKVNVVNIGNAQILTIPGEALPNIGFYLKRKMHGKNNLLFGLTNEAFGYILTKVDFNSFPRYDYVTRTSLGEMTGEIYIEESLKFVDKCPKPQ